ncbi:DUF4142 domain-containing protein [Chitinophaga flava]|uniref:DUF4142 domain-containing protein n=1 Tax=Chitinophaga flava TaxID=2259036 RepID=A0A365Y0M0_9BACT|nr:DUF4142 domain-containing protein [Chitinophaga flava]RBL92050.1 hypothetical protein DF182_05505 [Chitinophaga flava]
MKRLCIPVLAVVLMACGQRGNEARHDNTEAREEMTRTEEKEGSFLERMAAFDLKQIRLGEVAVQKATDDRVKKFGGDMIKQHTASTLQLQDIAHRQGVNLVPELSRNDQDEVGRLNEENKDEFDRSYIRHMVHEQKMMIERLNKDTNDKDTAIRSYVQRTLPALDSSMTEANKILEDMRKQMNNRNISHD